MKSLRDPVVTEALARRLEAITPASARRWGVMSPHEMLCHVADAFEVALGDRPMSGVRMAGPPALLKFLALRVPLPWMKNVPTGAGVNPRREGTRPSDFDADRERAVRLLRRLAASAGERPHPIFGLMSAADWLRWGYLHTDHHLRQFGG